MAALPELTRKRLKWLAETLDMPEVACISLAVKQLVEEYEEGFAD